MDVTRARWLKRCIDRQTNSARSNGKIGRWSRMSVESAKMAMKKYKVVITENEMDAETHGMGATEGNLWSVWRNDFRDAEARIEPKPGKKNKAVAHDRSILIASVSLRVLPIRYSEGMLMVIIVTDSKLGGFEDSIEQAVNHNLQIHAMKDKVPEICCFALAKIQSHSDTSGTFLPVQKSFDERTTEPFVTRQAVETKFR
jgi:hypothetical protein